MNQSHSTKRFLSLAGAVLLVDIVTKQWMLGLIFDPPRIIEVTPFFNLAPVWNPGVSFGVLAGHPLLVKIVVPLLALAIIWWLWRQLPSLGRWQQLAAGLIAGGAIGNVIDRLVYGRVVDFVDLHLAGWHWPAFNVADSALSIGVVLWLYEAIAGSKTPPQDRDGQTGTAG